MDDTAKKRPRVRAAQNGRPMEAEARTILQTARAAEEPEPPNLAGAIRGLFAPLGGVDLPASSARRSGSGPKSTK